jgi:hypothetical protein
LLHIFENRKNLMRSILKEFRTELYIVLILAVGFGFLLLDVALGGQLRSGLGDILNRTLDQLGEIRYQVSRYVLGFSPIQILAWAIIAGAIIWLVRRIRYRFRHSLHFAATACPDCESPIRRTHRSMFDRLLSKTFLPEARRYSCSNPQCGWSGLRHHRYRPQSFAPPEDLRPKPGEPSP